MIRYVTLLVGLVLAALLTACGGGGGSAGATSGGSSTGGGSTPITATPTVPTLALGLVNAAGSAISDNSVPSGTTVYAKVVVKDADGLAVANKLVVFVSGSGLVTFQPASGQVLTDTTGTAKVQLAPATISSGGAETLTASATVGSTNLSASLDIQTTPANVTLSNFTVGQSSLTAFQATSVSVDVAVNAVPAGSTPISVSFSANCGSFSPAQATSNSSSKASSTYQASGCSGGTATLTATALGSNALQTKVTVQSPAATNLLFVSATPSTIYTSLASFGVKQSTVKFKVVDASGAGVGAFTNVQISLSTSSIASGVQFADTNSTTPKIVATDANGEVSVIVKSGTVPTPLSLDAQLVSNPAITASSAGLTVNSGRPVQNFFSLSASVFNIEGWSYDNESTNVNILVADRLAQPVPAGTPISFIAEGGQVTASCSVLIDANNKSGCSVSLVSQAFRPSNGRVTVLAYTEGEEAFVDANGNNKYDPGETFFDMGQPFLDSNESGTYDAASEQKVGDPSVPGSGIGSLACASHPYLLANVANTCDGAWGTTRVRGQAVIVFSTSQATIPVATGVSKTGFNFTLADLNGNAMPFGTSVSAAISGGTNCKIVEVFPPTVPNGTNPSQHRVIITKGSDPDDTCTGAQITYKATTPKGNPTLLGTVNIP
jgi:hypothetical protein